MCGVTEVIQSLPGKVMWSLLWWLAEKFFSRCGFCRLHVLVLRVQKMAWVKLTQVFFPRTPAEALSHFP